MTETTIQMYSKEPERVEQLPIIFNIAQILQEILSETDKLESPQTLFAAQKIPSISLHQYLQRMAKYAKCSQECFILALIYLDRIQEKNSEIMLNSFCIHRFLITAVLVAIKYQDDDYYRNDYYSKIGGISTRELNCLEKEFLILLDYQTFVKESLFCAYIDKLEQYQTN